MGNFKPVLFRPLKWLLLKFFARLRKSPLLIASVVKGVLSHLNKLNLLLSNQILFMLCILIKPNVWYLWSLKILVIKNGFRSIWQKFYRAVVLWWMTKKLITFSRHIFWEQPSKYCSFAIYPEYSQIYGNSNFKK